MKQHVFISYSRKNLDFADQLIEALESANVPCWIDNQGIHHSDPSFETKLREAISQSFAAILIASPDSFQSAYVQGEIDIILERGVPLVVVWIDGEFYSDTVPTRLTRVSYIDCRLKNRKSGIGKAQESLLDLRNNALPKYQVISNEESSIPRCYLQIKFESSIMLIMPDLYNNMMDLTMDLYNQMLKKTFPPFAYVEEWLLVRSKPRHADTHIAVIPKEYFTKNRPTVELWTEYTLRDFYLQPGSSWEVIARDKKLPVLLLGIRDRYLFERLTGLSSQNTFNMLDKYLSDYHHIRKIQKAQISNEENNLLGWFAVYLAWYPDEMKSDKNMLII